MRQVPNRYFEDGNGDPGGRSNADVTLNCNQGLSTMKIPDSSDHYKYLDLLFDQFDINRSNTPTLDLNYLPTISKRQTIFVRKPHTDLPLFKMRASILAAVASMTCLASARIVGFAVPKTIATNSPFDITVISENYIQSAQEISIAYGVTSGPVTPYPGTLGRLVGSAYLGPDASNTLSNITITATLDGDIIEKGDGLFSAALTSLYGVAYGPVLQNFNASITVGDVTSEELVRSGAAY
ncbi:hypothetical protein EJ05DRAFT_473950 [Pseudovirgaria hyperparasitica]|uniref:Uncharacterized protein n=1 Tax=Pseudovirgaria hyperparasitica TaxID=470096 RepID=A0A6A6WF54_9PEZI|nr:uncharacterized protein EJ05DRAFT_473950 [Pseudovirgaria hyperparasitica]KAF2761452.1 hypothetical protein EJ05DRAFT_473950 [Pseudovirgaria hyperparasitica]